MTDIAVALGGGGIKGIAHVGALQKLVGAGYTIKAVAGTSAGGIVGAMIAAGYTPDDLKEIILNINQGGLFKRKPDEGPALLGLGGLTDILTEKIGSKTFKDLKIPYAATAVDLITSQELVINSGSVIDAILATVAVPGVFPPREIGQYRFIDGGVLDPVPVSVVRWLKPDLPIVAICLSPEPAKWSELNSFRLPVSSSIIAPIVDQINKLRIGQAVQIFLRSLEITDRMLAEIRLQNEKPDVIVRPNVERFGILDNVDPTVLMEEGVKSMEAKLPEILKTTQWMSTVQRKLTPKKHVIKTME
jgi:NTE family protein